ncbi:MAG: DUF4351 domain-containing protein [Pseudomonadota bacterium]
METPDDEYDAPWKEAVTNYFPEFMAFYFPAASERIDWSKPYRFLDQELAKLARHSVVGRRVLDKLVEVASLDGALKLFLIHVEVQRSREREFAKRIFTYHYRLYDRYRQQIASLVVLADRSMSWRPDNFSYTTLGCTMRLRYAVVKLMDHANQIDRLLSNQNAFALITAAHLMTQATRGKAEQRAAFKWKLARLLFDRQWDRERIADLFFILDWLLVLPEPLQERFQDDIQTLEGSSAMPFINSFERRGIKKGIEQGIEQGLEQGRKQGQLTLVEAQLAARFGPLSPSVKQRLKASSPPELEHWAVSLLGARSLDDVFRA